MSRSPIQILLVEDNPAEARLIDLLLRESADAEMKCQHESRLSDGLLRLQENTADAILLDLGLPDSEGLETVRRVRLTASNVPIIVLTGADDRTLGLKTIEIGADDFLYKGDLDHERLVQTLRYAIERATRRAKEAHHQIPGYQLLERIGAGTTATVYKARQLSLDRMVAIKVLPKKHTHDAEFVRRLYDEGRATAKLSHPNIVGALDVGRSGDHHYFVMEYVEGETVGQTLTNGPYEEKEAITIAIQIAQALCHAHEEGIIHRDVKPNNIMITKEGVAKLTDMGLARAVIDREAAEAERGKMYGTPFYISPEQVRGEVDIDFRSDIYCLAGTLYHMLTGRVPFDGRTPTTVMKKHLDEALVPPNEIKPELSHGTTEIIEVCMAKDRGNRYLSTSDLLEDLESVARGEPPFQARRKAVNLPPIELLAPQDGPQAAVLPVKPPFYATPMFWFAIIGWILFSLMVIAYLVNF